MSDEQIINFAPGPAKLPGEVLQQAQKELINYANTGLSVMEMSHRSLDFAKILNQAKETLKELLSIPDNYTILFLSGGGTGQFAAIPLNLKAMKPGRAADYAVTGAFSVKAVDEAKKYIEVNQVFPKPKNYCSIPEQSSWKMNPDAAYFYYCANETISGVEFHSVPDVPDGIPIVCDMSSTILSRPVDVSKFGVIIAGAQKNIGCAGVTLVIVRNDLIGHAVQECPSIWDYKVQNKNNSLYNTPPTYSIYIMGLVFEWLKKQGGAEGMAKINQQKASAVYDVIDNSNGFYVSNVERSCRSHMNIPLRVGSADGVENLESKFLEESANKGMKHLKGHRSVGGIRVSLYNAMSLDETQRLVTFMKDFQQRHQ